MPQEDISAAAHATDLEAEVANHHFDFARLLFVAGKEDARIGLRVVCDGVVLASLVASAQDGSRVHLHKRLAAGPPGKIGLKTDHIASIERYRTPPVVSQFTKLRRRLRERLFRVTANHFGFRCFAVLADPAPGNRCFSNADEH